jgi:hypothetical protein
MKHGLNTENFVAALGWQQPPWAWWKKGLQIFGAGRESRKTTQKVHAVRGPETKWEMADKYKRSNV